MGTNKKDILGIYKNISRHAIDIIFDIYQEIDKKEVEESNLINYYTINRVPKLFQQITNELKDIDFTQFTEDELKSLGFNKWDDEENCLMLAPRWVFLIMKPGTELTSISGNVKIFGIDEIDMDARFGITAWGFTKSQLRDRKISNFLDDNAK